MLLGCFIKNQVSAKLAMGKTLSLLPKKKQEKKEKRDFLTLIEFRFVRVA